MEKALDGECYLADNVFHKFLLVQEPQAVRTFTISENALRDANAFQTLEACSIALIKVTILERGLISIKEGISQNRTKQIGTLESATFEETVGEHTPCEVSVLGKRSCELATVKATGNHGAALDVCVAEGAPVELAAGSICVAESCTIEDTIVERTAPHRGIGEISIGEVRIADVQTIQGHAGEIKSAEVAVCRIAIFRFSCEIQDMTLVHLVKSFSIHVYFSSLLYYKI
jgi:hypothetical protein